MSYLVQQMWLCLLIAALIGALIGWWLAKSTYSNKLKNLEADWQAKLNRKSSDYSQEPNQSLDELAQATTSQTTNQSSTATATAAAAAASATVAAVDVDLESDLESGDESDYETKPITPDLSSSEELSSYDIEEVEGIGNNYGKKLRDLGINTTEQLLGQAYNMDGRIKIAENIGIEDFVILKWASMCDLMRVKGITGQLSEQIVDARIYSTQDLSQQNADTLHEKLSSSASNQNEIPDESSLTLMITEAKELETILQDD